MRQTSFSLARGTSQGQQKGMAKPITHPVSALVRTHDFSALKVCGRTGGDGQDVCEKTRTLFLRTILECRVWRRGWCISRASCDHLFGPQHELPPARLVLHRHTSAQNGVRGRGRFRRGQAYQRIYAPSNIGCE